MAPETNHNEEIVELLVKQRLRELVVAYSRAVDRVDEEAIVSLFHPRSLVDSGVICANERAFARKFGQWFSDNAIILSHSVCSSWFMVKNDTAIGESYVLALSRMNETHGGRQTMTAGRYLDRFACVSGEWRFAERRFVQDVSIDLGALSTDDDQAGSLRGRAGSDDPVYEVWSTFLRG